MIIVRRSKVELMQTFQKEMQKRPSEDADIKLILEHLNNMVDFRKTLLITEDFTEEEYMNTFNFVKLLNKELYEKLIGYKIIED